MKPGTPIPEQDQDQSAASRKWDHTAVHDLDQDLDPLRELHEFWRQKKASRERETDRQRETDHQREPDSEDMGAP